MTNHMVIAWVVKIAVVVILSPLWKPVIQVLYRELNPLGLLPTEGRRKGPGLRSALAAAEDPRDILVADPWEKPDPRFSSHFRGNEPTRGRAPRGLSSAKPQAERKPERAARPGSLAARSAFRS